MPMAYTAGQANGPRDNNSFPEGFRQFCAAHPQEVGCHKSEEPIWWSGTAAGSSRFENLWDEPYVFAIVVDAKGYWIYRWRPTEYEGKVQTGWSGLERFKAA